jgi:hypothetical protein
MHCRNCGHADRFVLLVELAALVGVLEPEPAVESDDRTDSSGRRAETAWSISLECPACASTDVSGDPVTLLSRLIR